MDKFPITREGYNKLEQEIKDLKYIERPKIIAAIATAREYGDLSENAEYHAAKEKQGFNEGKILTLEDKLARAEIIDVGKLSGDTIKFGATVKLFDNETEEEVSYTITGEYEADINKKRLSIVSPLAKALIKKTIGDIVEVSTPKGHKSFEVVEIKYEDFEL